jgi:tRNA pseudouridine38/39 synthase
MRAAAAGLVGSHDFRNYCRADIPTVTNFRRHLLDLTIDRLGSGGGGGENVGAACSVPNPPPGPGAPPRRALPAFTATPPPPGMDAVVITVTGSAFLWHQVRCLVAILHMVGKGAEQASIAGALLDVKGAFPSKPQYKMAPERPLLFCGAGFGGGELVWRRGRGGGEALAGLRELLRQQVAGTLLLAAAAAEVEEGVGGGGRGAVGGPAGLPAPKRRAHHRPLATRPRDPTLEDRLAARGLTVRECQPCRPVTVGVDGCVLTS